MPDLNITLPSGSQTASTWLNAIQTLNNTALAWYQTITQKPVFVSPGVSVPTTPSAAPATTQPSGASQTPSGGTPPVTSTLFGMGFGILAVIGLGLFFVFRR